MQKAKKLTATAFIFLILTLCLSFSTQAAMSEADIKARLSSYSESFTSYKDDTLYIDYPQWDVTQEEMYYAVSDIARALMGEPIEDHCKVSIRFYYKPGTHGTDLDSVGNTLFKYQKALSNFWTDWSRYNNMMVVATSHNGGEKFSAGVTLELNGSSGTKGERYNTKLMSIVKEAQSNSSSDMELVQYFLQWLDENVVYRYYTGFTNDPYYALIYGKAVCGGYANAFKDLCNAVGIPAIVPVNESLNHAWSQVYVDGIWYTADLCNVVKSKSNTYTGYLFTDPTEELDCKSFVERHKAEYVKSFKNSSYTSISSCTFTYDSKKTYTGSAIKPSVKVTFGGEALKKGTHYNIKYSYNTLPGTGKIKITGINKNGYKGTVTLDFKISVAKPSDLSAVTGKTSVKLSWDKVKGATGYIIRLYDTKSKKYIDLSKVKGTSCTVTSLEPGQKYIFAVRAYVSYSGSEYKGSQRKITVITKPAKVRNLKIYSVKADSLKLKWSAAATAKKYEIYLSTDGKSWTKDGTASKTSYTVKSLKANKKYYFKVRAVNGTGKGSFSSAKSTTTLLAPPDLKLTAGNNRISAEWNKVSGAKGYIIYYSTNSDVSEYKKVAVKGKSNVSAVLKSLKNKKKYYVRIRAYKTENGKKVYGKYSPIISIKTK